MTLAVATRFYTYPQAAEILGISESWLRHRGKSLPVHRFGRSVRFSEENLTEIASMFRSASPTRSPEPVVTTSGVRPRRPRRSPRQ